MNKLNISHTKILFTICVILISFNTQAQFNIKEIYEKLPNQDRFSNLLELRDYQSIQPEEPIGYFLLAEIYEAYMRDTDPLRHFYYVETNYMQQKVHYQLAKAKLDKKKARQYREMFGEVEIISGKKKAEYPDIVNEIDNRLSRCETYFGFANTLYQSYVDCINKYNQCLYDFREIIDLNPNYKDLYLLVDDEIITKIENIATNFEKSLKSFDSYQHACTKIPEKVEIPNYTLRPIITYRLEGLVESDFTKPNVELWDFGTWANEFLSIKNNEIDSIRIALSSSDEQLDRQIETLETEETYLEEWDAYKPDQVFQNRMAKYDYAALTNKLLEYRENKVDFLTQTRNIINDPEDSTQVFFINRLRFYNQLANTLSHLNQEADLLKNEANIDDMKKYLNFFEDRYGGISGFTRWCVVEQYKNTEIFNKNLNHLNQFINEESKPINTPEFKLKIEKDSIALDFNPIVDSLLKRDTIIPLYNQKINHKWNFISMAKIDQDSLRKSIIGRYTNSGETVWYKTPKVTKTRKGNYHHKITQLKINSDSTATAVYHYYHSTDSIKSIQNYAVHYNWEGEIEHLYLIDTTGVPRYFRYDDLNEEYFLITKGQAEQNKCDSMETVRICQLDSVGQPEWEKQMELQGEISGVIHTNSNYIVFSNYKNRGFNNQLQSVNAKSIAADYIDHDGNIKWSKTIEGETPLRFDHLYKINSNTINGFGAANDESAYLYVLMNMDGEVKFSNKKLTTKN